MTQSQSVCFCNHCGAANRISSKYCSACGSLLDETLPYTSSGYTSTLQAQSLLMQRYRISTPLGQGGFGTIYKAQDTRFNNALRAVKEMSAQSLDPAERQQAIAAFKHEAHLLAGLMHPNLPRIYDHFEEKGRWYLVMDYIEGETLEERLAKMAGGKMTVQQVLPIALQLCTVLHYLHMRQPPIIFRDLKPANVMLSADDHLYLIDFGIARLFKSGQAKDTVALGSPGYAAPEQYGKAQTTEQADIYSLGATLHHLLSGRDPSDEPFQFPPLKLDQAPGGSALAQLVRQMVETDKSKRPKSMQEVKQRLQNLSTQSGGQGTSPQQRKRKTVVWTREKIRSLGIYEALAQIKRGDLIQGQLRRIEPSFKIVLFDINLNFAADVPFTELPRTDKDYFAELRNKEQFLLHIIKPEESWDHPAILSLRNVPDIHDYLGDDDKA
jgi:F-box protein 11